MKNKYSNKYLIGTGMGLQDVDGLKNSSYFKQEAERYIKGEITLDELEQLINSYYQNRPDADQESKEPDDSSIRIAKVLSDDSFTFSVGQLISIHKQLFSDIFSHAGKLRTYNFVKKEWVLDGASVWYGDYRELETALQYDFDLERKFSYVHLTEDEIIDHLSIFIANLWQIHPFQEGNTRTTAVFVIKYLRTLGYDVSNDVFMKNAWYFRNALVRANYKHLRKGVYEDRSFLIKFLRNLLLHEKNKLRNRDLHINPVITSNVSKELRVLNYIENNPHITSEELANELDVSIRTIKAILKTLVESKTIERMDGKRYGYWKINNPKK